MEDAQQTPTRLSTKEIIPKHIIIKLPQKKDKHHITEQQK